MAVVFRGGVASRHPVNPIRNEQAKPTAIRITTRLAIVIGLPNDRFRARSSKARLSANGRTRNVRSWVESCRLGAVVLELPLRSAGNLTSHLRPVFARSFFNSLTHIIFDALRFEVSRDQQEPASHHRRIIYLCQQPRWRTHVEVEGLLAQ
jgi:hypothetical protein